MKQTKSRKKMLSVLYSALLTGCFLLLCGGNIVAQQPLTVSGTVIDKTGMPIAGATVLVVGTTNGTISDASGKFSLSGVPSNASLEFRFIGFEKLVVAVDGRTSFNIELVDEATMLGELVVVGYGTMKKSDVTGAMVSVSSEALNSMPVSNAIEALQGKAAGVDITSNERPGELGNILIRGVRSLNASNSPLYVVDGVPLMSASAIETINPRDIESIDVLKDASATAIYGSRGANGVIIVTTKRGKGGKLELNYSGSYTIENIVDKSPAMRASDYITWRRWAYYNSAPDIYTPGNAPTYSNDKIIFGGVGMDDASYQNIMSGWSNDSWDGSKVVDTDWTDFVTQTAITQEHTISASAGNETTNSYVSFGYLDNQGTMKGQEYARYTGKVSVDIIPKDWFKMGGTLNASWSEQEYGYSRTGQSSNSGPTSIYEAAKQIGRFALPYDENGDIINTPGNMGGNGSVYTVIDEWEKSNDNRQIVRVLGSFYAGINFGKIYNLLEGLSFSINFGPDFRHYRRGIYIDNSSAARLGSAGSYASLSNRRDFSWTLDQQLDYNKQIANHKFGVTLLHTSSSWNIENSGMSGNNIAKSSYLWNAMGTLDITATESDASMSSSLTERQLESYMTRLNYAFNEKYLLTLTGRWDGASQLAEGNKWDFFPALSLAWRLEQEEFIQAIPAINQLKLRFGIGTTGNSAIDPYQTLGAISSFYIPFGT
ncbi:MAG: SusC/RagA family TonB-linked outer membrane protein, partial [Bacteroidales bacterium]|nr:SusC/RagA family TonB-linked outer membrane protein [Bacteroidales bacterium]